MASSEEFVQYACECMARAGRIRARKMFGEYGVYCDGKLVALICDNQLFLKPTAAGRKYGANAQERPPYPGAKNYLLIDDLENASRLSEMVRVTCAELPAPRPKTKREKK